MTESLAGQFDTQGHRGCRGLMPENTVAAMLKAIDLGVTTLEMDVCISADNKVFLSHEPFFNHEITTKPGGGFIEEIKEKDYNMFKMTYDSITRYDVGMKPHPRFPLQTKTTAFKPLLTDVFEAVKKDMITRKRSYPFFNIETKTTPETDGKYHPGPAKFVDLLMNAIQQYGLEEQVIIQSFDFRTLQYLHKKYPAIKTAMLVEVTDNRSLRKQLDDLSFIPTIYSPAFELVTANLVAECHSRKIKIIPWTVNEKQKINSLKAMAVDGVISDYPNLF